MKQILFTMIFFMVALVANASIDYSPPNDDNVDIVQVLDVEQTQVIFQIEKAEVTIDQAVYKYLGLDYPGDIPSYADDYLDRLDNYTYLLENRITYITFIDKNKCLDYHYRPDLNQEANMEVNKQYLRQLLDEIPIYIKWSCFKA